MFDWFVFCLLGPLVGWLDGRVAGCMGLFDCWLVWLVGKLVAWLFGWFVGWG